MSFGSPFLFRSFSSPIMEVNEVFKKMKPGEWKIRAKIQVERRRIREIIREIMNLNDPEEYDSLKHEMDARVERVITLNEYLKNS